MPFMDLSKKLLEAARVGHIETVQLLLLNGAMFTTDWLGNTALHYAAQNGHEEMCQVLIRAGVDRNARTKVNRTPLHLAAQEGHLPVVQLFIASGADLHAADMIGMTALHWSVQKGHVDIVCLLLQHGANVALPNKFGKTPLDIASSTGQDDICQLLDQLLSSVEVDDSAAVEEVSTSQVIVYDAVPSDLNSEITDETTVLCVPVSDLSSTGSSLSSVVLPASSAVSTVAISVPDVSQVNCSVQSSCAAEDALLSSSTLSLSPTAAGGWQMTASDTLRWLRTHGTVMDHSSSLVTSVLVRGQTVVLTEAGKLLMSDVRPITDITSPCHHLCKVGKTRKADETSHTASDDECSESTSKKSKHSDNAVAHREEITSDQMCSETDSGENLTCNDLSQLLEPS